jgi:hypothetical protein
MLRAMTAYASSCNIDQRFELHILSIVIDGRMSSSVPQTPSGALLFRYFGQGSAWLYAYDPNIDHVVVFRQITRP